MRVGHFPVGMTPAMLPIGTVLERKYRGAIYRVEIAEAAKPGGQLTKGERDRGDWRYLYDGKRWRTLAEIARFIRNVRKYVSGSVFFGLQEYPQNPKRWHRWGDRAFRAAHPELFPTGDDQS